MADNAYVSLFLKLVYKEELVVGGVVKKRSVSINLSYFRRQSRGTIFYERVAFYVDFSLM